MFDKNAFGKRVQAARIANGLSQVELAEKLGVTKQTISNIETGYRATSIEMLYDICKLLNVSADELLGLNDK
jgi:transcriptional regulator with XRE-family HTH domain